MPGIPFFRYAEVQARVRARLGAMPDEARWHYLADANDLDNLIERMRSNGLAHWVRDLPRSPDTTTIENRLQLRLLVLLDEIGRLLPGRWEALRPRLRLAGNLPWARRLLAEPGREFELPAQIDPRLASIATFPVDERAAQLARTDYHRYLSAPSPLDRWLLDFVAACPKASGREGYVLRRILGSVHRHRAQLRALRKRALGGAPTDPAAQWRLRDRLAYELRALIGGYPFHAGLVLIYCLLELLHFERCRALLVARSRGWRRPPVTGAAA